MYSDLANFFDLQSDRDMKCVPFHACARFYLVYVIYIIDECAHMRETERAYECQCVAFAAYVRVFNVTQGKAYARRERVMQ